MEKDLKEYLDRLSGKVDNLSDSMYRLTSDVTEIKETMATKKELARVEKKLTKKIDETIEYVKAVDQDVSDHRRNTEAHIKPLQKA